MIVIFVGYIQFMIHGIYLINVIVRNDIVSGFLYFRNPYDIPRKSLIDQISRMRNNFFRTSMNSESLMELGKSLIFFFLMWVASKHTGSVCICILT